ncbi:hypothetical protein MRX96_044881 [Rhipicephalus microplus]
MSLKAFDLVPLSERVSTGAATTEITCLECSGRTLYVGTADGFLIQYDLEDHSWCDGRRTVATCKARQKFINTKKPVRTLKAMSALERLLCLSDGNFMCLNTADLDILAPLSKLKGISAFCINENPTRHDPFSIQVCAAKRKQLQLYAVTENKVAHQSDISLSEHALALAMDGDYICVATVTQYLVACCSTGHVQNLVPYDSDLTVPFVKRIAKGEFLLNGPSDLGIFATSSGVSQRPPLPWSASVSAVAYAHPYIVCLSEDYVTVYSIFDQQPKQRVPFINGTFLDNFEGKLVLAGRTHSSCSNLCRGRLRCKHSWQTRKWQKLWSWQGTPTRRDCRTNKTKRCCRGYSCRRVSSSSPTCSLPKLKNFSRKGAWTSEN